MVLLLVESSPDMIEHKPTALDCTYFALESGIFLQVEYSYHRDHGHIQQSQQDYQDL